MQWSSWVPYLVAATGHLRHVGSDWAELTTIKAEHEKLREKVLVLDYEKRKFKERYNLLVEEKCQWRII